MRPKHRRCETWITRAKHDRGSVKSMKRSINENVIELATGISWNEANALPEFINASPGTPTGDATQGAPRRGVHRQPRPRPRHARPAAGARPSRLTPHLAGRRWRRRSHVRKARPTGQAPLASPCPLHAT